MLRLYERTSSNVGNGATAARFLQQHPKLQQHFTAKAHITIDPSIITMVGIRIGSRNTLQQQTFAHWQQDCKRASNASKCDVRSNYTVILRNVRGWSMCMMQNSSKPAGCNVGIDSQYTYCARYARFLPLGGPQQLPFSILFGRTMQL